MSLFFCLSSIFGQSFNGSIDFKYATQKDTTSNVYWVKNKQVKLDQYSKKGNNVEGSFLFDLAAGEIKFLNPKRKLWGKQKSETPQVIKGQCVVTKGTATKKIAGVKCLEYTVKNTEENTVITYWIADERFEFFIPLIKLWNRKDKQSIYFGQIKGLNAGQMPMMSEERQVSDGKLLTKLEVVSISKTAPKDATFEIPAGYTKFEQ
ncbi:MAG: DUF4412 domain-containing protein [Bacteroidia bacterium]|nr:DUF4412 domain-containing protein [Bacteroidia bacterium]